MNFEIQQEVYMPLFFLIPIVAGALTLGAVAKHEVNVGASLLGSAEPATMVNIAQTSAPQVANTMPMSPMQEPRVAQNDYPRCAKNTDKRGPHDSCWQNDQRRRR